MQLYYTPFSPYARVTRIVALILGSDVRLVETAVREDATDLLAVNPAAKVPSLLLADGVTLSEMRLICEHLATLAQQPLLAPVGDPVERGWEGLCSGFLDGVAVWVREARRPPQAQSAATIALERARCARCLAYFEQHWHCEPRAPAYADIVLACTLDLIRNCALRDWESAHPRMSAWLAGLITEAPFQQTAPHG